MSDIEISHTGVIIHPGWKVMPEQVAKAVSQVMADVRGVEKTGNNKFHGYKYATASELLAELQPAMARHGLVITQSEVERTLLGASAPAQALVVTFAFGLHAAGASWESPVRHSGMASLFNQKGGIDDKAYNKAHTSARKYFLLAQFQVPTLEEGDIRLNDGDPDADPGPPKHAPQRQEPQRLPAPVARFPTPESRRVVEEDPEPKPLSVPLTKIEMVQLTERAKEAKTPEDGQELLRRWNLQAVNFGNARDAEEWTPLLAAMSVALSDTLGDEVSEAFGAAVSLASAEDAKFLRDSWAGKWAEELKKLRAEWPDAWRYLGNITSLATKSLAAEQRAPEMAAAK